MGAEIVTDVERSEFDRLFLLAATDCAGEFNPADVERVGVPLVKMMRKCPGIAVMAAERFCEAVDSGVPPWEVVAFCMHGFPLVTVLQKVKAELASAVLDPRARGVLTHILKSFQADWDDRELYDFYVEGTAPADSDQGESP
jgi:hypothetical protein